MTSGIDNHIPSVDFRTMSGRQVRALSKDPDDLSDAEWKLVLKRAKEVASAERIGPGIYDPSDLYTRPNQRMADFVLPAGRISNSLPAGGGQELNPERADAVTRPRIPAATILPEPSQSPASKRLMTSLGPELYRDAIYEPNFEAVSRSVPSVLILPEHEPIEKIAPILAQSRKEEAAYRDAIYEPNHSAVEKTPVGVTQWSRQNAVDRFLDFVQQRSEWEGQVSILNPSDVFTRPQKPAFTMAGRPVDPVPDPEPVTVLTPSYAAVEPHVGVPQMKTQLGREDIDRIDTTVGGNQPSRLGVSVLHPEYTAIDKATHTAAFGKQERFPHHISRLHDGDVLTLNPSDNYSSKYNGQSSKTLVNMDVGAQRQPTSAELPVPRFQSWTAIDADDALKPNVPVPLLGKGLPRDVWTYEQDEHFEVVRASSGRI
jgi:hypothetical protein